MATMLTVFWAAIAMDGRLSSAFPPEKTNPRSVFLNAQEMLKKGLLGIAFREDIKERSVPHCILRRQVPNLCFASPAHSRPSAI